MSEHLQHLADHRDDFTVFSGLDHGAGNGHNNWDNFLCGPKIGSISLDQVVAEQIAPLTRIPSFQLCTRGRGSQKLSYNRQGVPLPLIERPSVIYKQLFCSADDRKRTDYLLRSGQSALDTVLDGAKRLQKNASVSNKLPADLVEQKVHVTLKANNKRVERQILPINKNGKLEVTFAIPADHATADLSVAAFVGEDYGRRFQIVQHKVE